MFRNYSYVNIWLVTVENKTFWRLHLHIDTIVYGGIAVRIGDERPM